MKRLMLAALAPLCAQAQSQEWEWSLFADRIQPKASIQTYQPDGTLWWYTHRTADQLSGKGLRLSRTGASHGPLQWATDVTYRPASYGAIQRKNLDGSPEMPDLMDPGMYGYGYLGLGTEARLQAGALWSLGLEWREESSAFKTNVVRFGPSSSTSMGPIGTVDYREKFRHGRAWVRAGARFDAAHLPLTPFVKLEAAWATRPIGYDTRGDETYSVNAITRMAPMHQLALHVGIRM